jgi:hypothetical protein
MERQPFRSEWTGLLPHDQQLREAVFERVSQILAVSDPGLSVRTDFHKGYPGDPRDSDTWTVIVSDTGRNFGRTVSGSEGPNLKEIREQSPVPGKTSDEIVARIELDIRRDPFRESWQTPLPREEVLRNMVVALVAEKLSKKDDSLTLKPDFISGAPGGRQWPGDSDTWVLKVTTSKKMTLSEQPQIKPQAPFQDLAVGDALFIKSQPDLSDIPRMGMLPIELDRPEAELVIEEDKGETFRVRFVKDRYGPLSGEIVIPKEYISPKIFQPLTSAFSQFLDG